MYEIPDSMLTGVTLSRKASDASFVKSIEFTDNNLGKLKCIVNVGVGGTDRQADKVKR